MSALRPALADYLGVRRALGFRLDRAEKLLGQFVTYTAGRTRGRSRTRPCDPVLQVPDGGCSAMLTSVTGMPTGRLALWSPASRLV